MKKPIKYLIAVLICCISTALLVFGVRQISYSLSGTINYEVNSLYTDVTTSLYALNLPLEQSEGLAVTKMYSLQKSLKNDNTLPQDVVKLNFGKMYSTMGNGVSNEKTLTANEQFIVNYGDYVQDSQVPTAPVFYLVFEVKNYSGATISASLDSRNLQAKVTNSIIYQIASKMNIYGKTDGQEYNSFYFITTLCFDKYSILKTYNFNNLTFIVNSGELVATPESQFTFSTGGSTATLTKYNGTDTDVVIPSHLKDGRTVKYIGSQAFFNNTKITNVYIPDTVTSISTSSSTARGAFYGCINLNIVDIQGNSLVSIGGYAFEECVRLTSITIPNSVRFFGTTSWGNTVFSKCKNLKNVNYLGTLNDWLKIIFGGEYANPLCYGANLFINGELLTELTEDDFINLDGSEISKINDCVFSGCKSLTSVIIPNFVTSIGSESFFNCDGLTSITIPNWVDSIGSSSFKGCDNLKEVFLPTNSNFTKIEDETFSSCTSLTTLTIPNTIESIGRFAFYSCDNLKTVMFTENPNFVTIEDGMFSGCKSLTSITIPEGVESIGSYAFDGCDSLTSITIPNTIESIGIQAFYDCSNLKEVTLPTNDSFKTINSNTFYNCTSLTSITIPSNVTSIGSYAFYKCSNLKEVNFIGSVNDWLKISFSSSYSNPLCNSEAMLYTDKNTIKELTEDDFLGIVEIPAYAFRNCIDLVKVSLPNTIQGLGNYAFAHCKSLVSISIPESVENIGSYAFSGCTNLKEVILPTNDILTNLSSYIFYNCNSLTNITIPNSVTSIGSYSFYNCKSLTSVTIPGGVESIESSAFSGCSSLKEVTLPTNEKFSTINYSTFRGCISLTSITIPESVESIEDYAFYNCTKLKDVYYSGSVNDWLKISFSYNSSNPLYNGANLYINEELLTEVTEDNFKNLDGTYLSIIKNYAFYNCSSLTSITIPSSVTSIGSEAFRYCTNLKVVFNLSNITITAGSPVNGYVGYYVEQVISDVPNPENYIIEDGIYYYEIDGSNKVFLGPDPVNGYTLNIPDGTTNITKSLITSLLPDGVDKNIITNIMIPSSVVRTGFAAFDDCDNVKEVNYLGSVNEWLKINFGGVSSSNPLSKGADLYINGELLTEVTEDDFKNLDGTYLSKINSCVFTGCESLTSITIPNSVTRIGDSAFSGCSSLKEVYYLGSVNDWLKISFSSSSSNPVSYAKNLYINGKLLTEVTEDDFVGLTAINSYAFHGCKSLTSITIPKSVESIGNYAFYNCDSLTSITIPNSIESIGSYAFYGCGSLKEMTLPTNDSFKTINSYTFYNCTSLTSITIPSSVTSIGSYAFYECSNLKEVNYLGLVNDWLKISFSDSYSNPLNSGADLYINGKLLTEITEDDFVNITTISSYAFEGCTSLINITIPESVESIGKYAFSDCNNLGKVNYLGTINKWLQMIISGGTYSNPLIYSNEGLYIKGNPITELTENDFVGITSIPLYAFRNCKNLEKVTLADTIKSIGSDAFYNCTSLITIKIPNSVTSIGVYTFYNCTKLKEVNLPTNQSFTSIGSYSFYNCISLDTIIIPNSVKSIGNYSFQNCSSLKTIIIPSSVTSIGNYAFDNCGSLYTIVVDSEIVLKGLTGRGSGTMGYILSGVDDVLDRIYVLKNIESSMPSYITKYWTRLELTETVDGREYILFIYV